MSPERDRYSLKYDLTQAAAARPLVGVTTKIKVSFSPPNRPISGVAIEITSIKYRAMLVELHLEGLIADEKAADEVWGLWDAGEITDDMAALAWPILVAAGTSLEAR